MCFYSCKNVRKTWCVSGSTRKTTSSSQYLTPSLRQCKNHSSRNTTRKNMIQVDKFLPGWMVSMYEFLWPNEVSLVEKDKSSSMPTCRFLSLLRAPIITHIFRQPKTQSFLLQSFLVGILESVQVLITNRSVCTLYYLSHPVDTEENIQQPLEPGPSMSSNSSSYLKPEQTKKPQQQISSL